MKYKKHIIRESDNIFAKVFVIDSDGNEREIDRKYFIIPLIPSFCETFFNYNLEAYYIPRNYKKANAWCDEVIENEKLAMSMISKQIKALSA